MYGGRHGQELENPIGKLDEVIPGQRQILFDAPVALLRKQASNLPGRLIQAVAMSIWCQLRLDGFHRGPLPAKRESLRAIVADSAMAELPCPQASRLLRYSPSRGSLFFPRFTGGQAMF